MKKTFFSIVFFLFVFEAYSQFAQKDQLKLEVRCFDKTFAFKKEEPEHRPTFIIGIRNNGLLEVNLKTGINIGFHGDTSLNDLTFELDYVTKKDTINALKNFFDNERVHKNMSTNKIKVNSTAGYFFEFDSFSEIFFQKSGTYRVRFTLLKKYNEEYLTQNTSTNWIYFNIISFYEKRSKFSLSTIVANGKR